MAAVTGSHPGVALINMGAGVTNINILARGSTVRFSTLAALCRELDCQPGDLVIYEAGPSDEPDEDEDE